MPVFTYNYWCMQIRYRVAYSCCMRRLRMTLTWHRIRRLRMPMLTWAYKKWPTKLLIEVDFTISWFMIQLYSIYWYYGIVIKAFVANGKCEAGCSKIEGADSISGDHFAGFIEMDAVVYREHVNLIIPTWNFCGWKIGICRTNSRPSLQPASPLFLKCPYCNLSRRGGARTVCIQYCTVYRQFIYSSTSLLPLIDKRVLKPWHSHP